MTFQEKQRALLADLEDERSKTDPLNSFWLSRLDQKIAEMREAIAVTEGQK